MGGTTETPPPVSPLQVVESVARFSGCFAHPHIVLHLLADELVQARFTYAQIYPHRKKPPEEYWKKNSLALNAEPGAMIQNTTTCFFDGPRDRRGLVGR
jgi:hypothetical protein